MQHDVDESESSSSSDSDDSGSESDSESSDSEDASSTTEDATAKARAAAPTNFMSATTQDDEASSELTFLGQSTNSTGFGDGIISGATSALWSRDVFPELTSDVSQSTRASFGFIPLSQHVLPEDSDVSKVKRPPSPKQRKDSSREDTHGKKRKHEPESQPVARKAPKAMNTKGADTKSTLHRGETGAQKGPQKRKSLRRDSSLSSFSVSESDNSDDGSSSSSEEEEEGGGEEEGGKEGRREGRREGGKQERRVRRKERIRGERRVRLGKGKEEGRRERRKGRREEGREEEEMTKEE